ncbi:MAG TPA: calcium-binding EGF-like domain-containing protein [Polyangiales bacterium]|nr:calcium-binding EGF-like domain-containing protein [Polyangiales bacterium]
MCAPGYTRSSDGHCLAQDGKACDADKSCLNHHCESGICCAVRCDRPPECHSAEAASCNDGKTCSYVPVADGTGCDDARACTIDSKCKQGECTGGQKLDCNDANPCTRDSCEEPVGCRNLNTKDACDDHDPCTLGDACNTGECAGAAKSCQASDGSCAVGSCNPESGECVAIARADGTACDDANSCTLGEACAAGSCSAPHTTCGPHATACSSAQPQNQCSCEAGFVDNMRGRCVPETDECATQSACSPDADCEDRSSEPGDFVCTCKKGFTGDGRSCSVQDACAGNPCGEGRGTCISQAPGEHSCACAPGFVEKQGHCVCEMAGTFAVRSDVDLTWGRKGDLIEPGTDSAYDYAIEHVRYDAAGNLELEHVPCGTGPLDLCGIGSAPTLAAEAYASYIPATIWDLHGMHTDTAHVHPIEQPIPGAAFETDSVAHLQGIGLKDPLGEWPASRHHIAGTNSFDGSATNTAVWLDQDNDGFVGLTNYVVPPGGLDDSAQLPAAPRAYGAYSPVCPRTGGPHTPYGYLPAPAQGSTAVPVRVKRFYSAVRMITAYRGTISSCDEISGELLGNNGEPPKLEMRIGGCIRKLDEQETACNDTAIDFLDSTAQLQIAASARFRMQRWPADTPVSCAAARAMTYD